jgi:hypothetical protein
MDEQRHKKPRPSYFVKDERGIWQINDESPQWIATVEKYARKQEQKEKAQKGTGKIKDRATVDSGTREAARKAARAAMEKAGEEEISPELMRKSARAEIELKIYKNEIARQQAIQEEVKTLEMQKEVAPMLLLVHWWSYKENLTARIFRRPAEISPEVKALYLANEDKLAEQKITRELEAIIQEVHNELVKDVTKEGFKMPLPPGKNNND